MSREYFEHNLGDLRPTADEKEIERLLDKLAQLRATAETAQSKADDDWLDSIGKQWKAMYGKPWETLDGEERMEGIDANIGRMFQVIEELRTAAQRRLEMIGASISALRSYECGNASPDLAKKVADGIEAELKEGK